MSQLNPNAAEFVPVSPTRSIPSPACRLMHDPVIAQSPKRPSEIDINLPNPQEFEKEVKSRPSDVDSFSNGHDQEGDQKPSTQELMENLLNGKNIDEIPEFQPGNTPSKVTASDEFHFGPNAAPFTPAKLLDQSEAALSTKAVCGDESTVNLDSTLEISRDNADFAKLTEVDPMSMSFYQDKSSDDADPFDLNKVQMLPENLEDFLNKPDGDNILQDNIISDLPKHQPPKDLLSDDIILNNDERIQTTDLDRIDDEKELASPVSKDDESSGVCELAKSPIPQVDDLMCQVQDSLPKEIDSFVCIRPESKSPQDIQNDLIEPDLVSPEQEIAPSVPPTLSPELQIESPVLSPEPTATSPIPPAEPVAISPVPQTLSPEPGAASPVHPTLSSEPVLPCPETQTESSEREECLLSFKIESPVVSPTPHEAIASPELHEPVVSPTPHEAIPSPELHEHVLSPEPQKEAAIPELDIVSAEQIVSQPLSPEPIENVCQISKSPVFETTSPEPVELVCERTEKSEQLQIPEPQEVEVELCNLESVNQIKELVESPAEDITSSVKDITSPIISPVPDQLAADQNIQLSFAQEINNAVQSTVTIETSSPIKEGSNIPDLCPLATPKSIGDTESVATTDVNSFLERSQISELASPLSPGDSTVTSMPAPMNLYPLPTEIETENITPEFAEPVVLTPTESKEETPSVPSVQEETVKEPEVVAVETEPAAAAAAAGVVAAVGVAAATAAVVSEKKTPKAKPGTITKKPAVKTATSPTKPAASPMKAKPAPAAKAKLPAAAKPTAPTTRTSTGALKPPLSKPAPKPRTPTTTTTKPSIERKSLANGDVKASVKANLTARRSTEAVKSPASKPATTTLSKPSPAKPAAPRPTTAPLKPAAKPSTTTTAKPRPSTLANKTTTTTSVSKTLSSTTTAAKLAPSKITSSLKTATSPKPRPATAPPKPRVPATKTVTKVAADTEKQNKDSANKLTASRTGTSTRTTVGVGVKNTASTVRKTESKVTGATRTTVTKTTTTTTRMGAASKKPLEITRNGSKTTKTTKIEKPIQNGVTTVITEQITTVNNVVDNSETQLLKDNSPIDNKLLVDTNATD